MSTFIPRKISYRKPHKGNKGHILGVSTIREYSTLQGGNAIIYMCSNVRISSQHFEVMRLLCSKILKAEKKGSFKFIHFSNRPITKKAAETRMGGGKGTIDKYVAMLRQGDVLIEFFDVPEEIVKRIFGQITCKIPGKVSLSFTGGYNV